MYAILNSNRLTKIIKNRNLAFFYKSVANLLHELHCVGSQTSKDTISMKFQSSWIQNSLVWNHQKCSDLEHLENVLTIIACIL